MGEFYESQNDEYSIISYDISVIPNDFNVMTINSLIESGVIEMPVFQRNYVWDKKRASRFIESLILGLPIPQIFLYQVERNKYSIIDGQQRLMSIYFFIKQRFPKTGKRVFLRQVFNDNGRIPEKILSSNEYFQDFKLQFPKQENGKPHPMNNKNYETLDSEQKNSFNLMPIRCMSIRQNRQEDIEAVYEIFNRLNTGGLNLYPQEIRGCLYSSSFYSMIYELNRNEQWRMLLGKEEDDKCRDVEIILRCFALLYDKAEYTGSMVQFLNKFSKKVQKLDKDKIEYDKKLFLDVVELCNNLGKKEFLAKNNSFNVSLFDSVFVAVAEKIIADGKENAYIEEDKFKQLKEDDEFKEVTTHSTSHVDSLRKRLELANYYLYDANN